MKALQRVKGWWAERKVTKAERQLRRNEANARRLAHHRGDENKGMFLGGGGG